MAEEEQQNNPFMQEVDINEGETPQVDANADAPAAADDNAAEGDEAAFDDEQEGEEEVDEQEPCEMEGLLQKKGNQGKIRLWKKRYCRLYEPNEERGAVIRYFKNQKERKALGFIDLNGALSVERTPGGKPGAFQITMKSISRVWLLQAPKADEADLWIDAIRKYVDEQELAEPIELDDTIQGMIPAEPKRLRRDTSDGQPMQQPVDGDIALVLWGSDLTYIQEVRNVELKEDGGLTLENLPVGLMEGTFSLKSHNDPKAVVDQHTFRYDPKNAAQLIARLPDGANLKVSAPLARKRPDGAEFEGALLKDHGAAVNTLLGSEANRFLQGKEDEGKSLITDNDFALVNDKTVHFLKTNQLTSIEIKDDLDPKELLRNAHLDVVITKPDGSVLDENEHLIEMSYVTADSFQWTVEYNCILEPRETLMEFNGWHIITNRTDRDIVNGKFVFLAVPEREVGLKRKEAKAAQQASMMTGTGAAARVKSAFTRVRALLPSAVSDVAANLTSRISTSGKLDRRRYVARRRLSVPAGHTTALRIAASSSVPTIAAHLVRFDTPKFQRRVVISGRSGASAKSHVESVVRFRNDAKNELGVPLPPGLVHVYRRDKDGFGVERIASLEQGHAGVDELVTVPIEELRNVRATRKQTGFTFDADKSIIVESIEITVSSARQNAVDIIIEDKAHRWGHYELTASSLEPARETHLPRTLVWNVRLGSAAEPAASRKVTLRYTIMYSRFVVDTSLEEEKEREKNMGKDTSGRSWQTLAMNKPPAEPK